MNDALSLYNSGTRALQAGQLRPALTLLQNAIDATTNEKIQGAALRNKGVVLRRLNSPTEAVEAFLAALELDNEDLLKDGGGENLGKEEEEARRT